MLDVTDLQHEVFFLRQRDEFAGLRGIVGDGFFDEDVLPLLHQLLRDLEMENRRRDDVQRVARGSGFVQRIKNVELVFVRHGAGAGGVRIKNAGQLNEPGGVEFRVNAGVVLAERTRAEDGDFDFLHRADSASETALRQARKSFSSQTKSRSPATTPARILPTKSAARV